MKTNHSQLSLCILVILFAASTCVVTGCGDKKESTDKTVPAKVETEGEAKKAAPAETPKKGENKASANDAPKPVTKKDAPKAATNAGVAAAGQPTSGSKSKYQPADFPPPNAPSTIKLVDAGKDPKNALRWRVKSGDVQKLKMGMKMSISGAMLPQKIEMPMSLDADFEVKTANADNIDFTMKLVDIELDLQGPMAAAAGPMKDSIKGVEIEGSMDSRGIVKGGGLKLKIDNPALAQIANNMNQQFNNTTIPWPAEAVGVGAKWDALQHVDINGLKVRSVTSYELTELQGDTGKLSMSLTLEADAQAFAADQMPPGASAQLKTFKGGMNGTIGFELSKPFAPVMKGAMEFTMDLEINAQGQTQRAAMTMGMDLDVKPRN